MCVVMKKKIIRRQCDCCRQPYPRKSNTNLISTYTKKYIGHNPHVAISAAGQTGNTRQRTVIQDDGGAG